MSERLQNLADGRTEPKAKGFGAWIGGRARRREYWLWMAPTILLQGVFAEAGLTGAFLIGIPVLLVWIRRLHDFGFSGWFAPLINVAVNVMGAVALAFLPPAVGAAVSILTYLAALVILGVLPGDPRSNSFGPPPGKTPSNLRETFS